MIRCFCDACGNELTDKNRPGGALGRLTNQVGKKAGMYVEVMTGKDGVSNAGNWCKYCIIDEINKLDDRVK